MLPGLTSRWMTPMRCAWTSPRQAPSTSSSVSATPGASPRAGSRRPSALDVLHDDVVAAADLVEAEVEDLHDVRVHEARGRQRLAAKARDELAVVGEMLGQQLDRDLALEAAVDRDLDGRHAAVAEALPELVAAGDDVGAHRRRLVIGISGVTPPPGVTGGGAGGVGVGPAAARGAGGVGVVVRRRRRRCGRRRRRRRLRSAPSRSDRAPARSASSRSRSAPSASWSSRAGVLLALLDGDAAQPVGAVAQGADELVVGRRGQRSMPSSTCSSWPSTSWQRPPSTACPTSVIWLLQLARRWPTGRRPSCCPRHRRRARRCSCPTAGRGA